MKTAPTLHTERLILRSFTLDDAPDVQRITSDPDIVSTTPGTEELHKDGMAEDWIVFGQKWFESGSGVAFAVILKADGTFLGDVELNIRNHLPYNDAFLGYWIGKPYWNNGYCTEAAKAVITYGFRECGLDSILAYHFARNPASGRVMQKIGMKYWDYFPNQVEHLGVLEDEVGYSISKDEFLESC